MTPEQRNLRARLAAHSAWANTPDPAVVLGAPLALVVDASKAWVTGVMV